MSISSILSRLWWLEGELSPDASMMGDADLRRALGGEADWQPIIEWISSEGEKRRATVDFGFKD